MCARLPEGGSTSMRRRGHHGSWAVAGMLACGVAAGAMGCASDTLRDAGVPGSPDGAPGWDAARAPDLSLGDLAIDDLARAPDLAVAPDLAAPPDQAASARCDD